MYRTMFSVSSTSNANYLCIMSYRNDQDQYSLYVVVMSNSFDLAPDMLIVKNSKSVLGGLFGSSDEHIVRVPHIMTPDDLQMLLDYFDIITYDRFMKYFNTQTVLAAPQIEDFSSYRGVPLGFSVEDFTSLLNVVDLTW